MWKGFRALSLGWRAAGGAFCWLGNTRKTAGDGNHYGDPDVQRALALFQKVPREEESFENLVGQDDPTQEDMDVEHLPFSQEVT